MLNIDIKYAKSYYIPRNQFNKGWWQLDSCLCIKYGWMGVTQKIGGYNLVFRIPEVTFHWSFGSFPVFNNKLVNKMDCFLIHSTNIFLPIFHYIIIYLIASQIASYVASLASRTVKSTTDTSGVGTLNAIPVSFPFKSGITFKKSMRH